MELLSDTQLDASQKDIGEQHGKSFNTPLNGVLRTVKRAQDSCELLLDVSLWNTTQIYSH